MHESKHDKVYMRGRPGVRLSKDLNVDNPT